MTDTLSLTTWPIVGHDLAARRLARAAEGHPAHAYLFNGPDHIGKRTLARTFAQALFCTSPGPRPCGECRACKLVQANRHPDFLTLDMQWQTMNVPKKEEAHSISVDAVRLINSELSRRPHEGAWKVLLVPNVDDFTVAASNAFLKTLEEPPAHAIILLTTRDAELLLPTIRSRCQAVPLFPVPLDEVERALTARWGAEPEQARLLARLSEGRVGWAIEATQNPQVLERRQRTLETLQRVLASNRAERLLLSGDLGKANDADVMRVWAGWWRDTLLVQSGAEESVSNVDQRDALRDAASRFQPGQIHSVLRELQRLRRLANDTNVTPQLLWDVLLLKLPHAA